MKIFIVFNKKKFTFFKENYHLILNDPELCEVCELQRMVALDDFPDNVALFLDFDISRKIAVDKIEKRIRECFKAHLSGIYVHKIIFNHENTMALKPIKTLDSGHKIYQASEWCLDKINQFIINTNETKIDSFGEVKRSSKMEFPCSDVLFGNVVNASYSRHIESQKILYDRSLAKDEQAYALNALVSGILDDYKLYQSTLNDPDRYKVTLTISPDRNATISAVKDGDLIDVENEYRNKPIIKNKTDKQIVKKVLERINRLSKNGGQWQAYKNNSEFLLEQASSSYISLIAKALNRHKEGAARLTRRIDTREEVLHVENIKPAKFCNIILENMLLPLDLLLLQADNALFALSRGLSIQTFSENEFISSCRQMLTQIEESNPVYKIVVTKEVTIWLQPLRNSFFRELPRYKMPCNKDKRFSINEQMLGLEKITQLEFEKRQEREKMGRQNCLAMNGEGAFREHDVYMERFIAKSFTDSGLDFNPTTGEVSRAPLEARVHASTFNGINPSIADRRAPDINSPISRSQSTNSSINGGAFFSNKQNRYTHLSSINPSMHSSQHDDDMDDFMGFGNSY